MKINMFIVLSGLAIICLLAGCQQAQSTLSALTPINSLLGIEIGASTSEVISHLGAPTSYEKNSSTLTYMYGSGTIEVKYVYFDSTTEAVSAVITTCSLDNLAGVQTGKTQSEVKNSLGEGYKLREGVSYYVWEYDPLNVIVVFSFSTNTVSSFGIFNPKKIRFMIS
jgi:hypothetical protein